MLILLAACLSSVYNALAGIRIFITLSTGVQIQGFIRSKPIDAILAIGPLSSAFALSRYCLLYGEPIVIQYLFNGSSMGSKIVKF